MWSAIAIFLVALGLFFCWTTTLLIGYEPHAPTAWVMFLFGVALFVAAGYYFALARHLSYRRATLGSRTGTFGYVTSRTLDNIVNFAAVSGRGNEGSRLSWRPLRIIYFLIDDTRVTLEIRPSNALQSTQIVAEFPTEWIYQFRYGTASQTGLPAAMSFHADGGQRIDIGFSYLGTLGPYSVSAFGISPFHHRLDTLVENARRRQAEPNRGQGLG